ncbi:hypothetical protein FHX52_2226 [Humibacillus xanthopallidus]|uniref:Uncharacterized protein n=1 Tax=Humibacillus xanthopallidus TaxID=412689 RepID=A0A543PYB9_9MICO|nr:hypothetical protein FHX52_2226 [Humibacillus xanthopallidus]
MSRVRLVTIVVSALLATVFSAGAGPTASAAPQAQANDALAALWTSVLETPSAQNSFGDGGQEYACWDLGGIVAPFHPVGAESCTVKPGTKIFIVGYSYECSTFEGNGSTEAELRACARENSPTESVVRLDGEPVPVTEAETPLLPITLPSDNLFGMPAGTTGLSVGHGWVAPLHPLTPGTHTIVISTGALPLVTTQIIVEPGS